MREIGGCPQIHPARAAIMAHECRFDQENTMKLRNSVLAGLMGVSLIGSSALVSGSALARDRDGDERCGNCGTVVDVHQVKHKDSHLGAGTAIGAVAGGLLGHTVGNGDGRTAATVGGAVAGGAIGHEVEKNNRDGSRSWRFAVDMDNGRHVTVQMADNPDIQNGDRVRVSNGRIERY
jgi:outer membrane lipoprotein SlyB